MNMNESTSQYKLTSFEVDGNNVEIAYTEYDNKIFLLITEFGKIGNLVSVSQDTSDVDKCVVFNTSTLLGKDEPEIHAAARYIVQQLGFTKHVILGLALKNFSSKTVQNLTNCIKTNIK